MWSSDLILLKLFKLLFIECVYLVRFSNFWVGQVSLGHFWGSEAGFADHFADVPHHALLNLWVHLVSMGFVPVLCHVEMLERKSIYLLGEPVTFNACVAKDP